MAALQQGRSSHGSPWRNVSAYQFAATSNYPQIHLGWGEGEQKGEGWGRVSTAPEGAPTRPTGCFPALIVRAPPLRLPQFLFRAVGVGTTGFLGQNMLSLVVRL